MSRLKYFYQDHREQIILAGKYGICVAIVLASTWLTIACLTAMAAYDIWTIRN